MKIVKNPVHKQKLQYVSTTSDFAGDFLKLDGSNALGISITRDGSGVATDWTVGEVTYTATYSGEFMTSYTDGTSTWTISRNANNQVTGVTVT